MGLTHSKIDIEETVITIDFGPDPALEALRRLRGGVRENVDNVVGEETIEAPSEFTAIPRVPTELAIPMNVEREETAEVSSARTTESAIPMNADGEETIEVSSRGVAVVEA